MKRNKVCVQASCRHVRNISSQCTLNFFPSFLSLPWLVFNRNSKCYTLYEFLVSIVICYNFVNLDRLKYGITHKGHWGSSTTNLNVPSHRDLVAASQTLWWRKPWQCIQLVHSAEDSAWSSVEVERLDHQATDTNRSCPAVTQFQQQNTNTQTLSE